MHFSNYNNISHEKQIRTRIFSAIRAFVYISVYLPLAFMQYYFNCQCVNNIYANGLHHHPLSYVSFSLHSLSTNVYPLHFFVYVDHYTIYTFGGVTPKGFHKSVQTKPGRRQHWECTKLGKHRIGTEMCPCFIHSAYDLSWFRLLHIFSLLILLLWFCPFWLVTHFQGGLPLHFYHSISMNDGSHTRCDSA